MRLRKEDRELIISVLACRSVLSAAAENEIFSGVRKRIRTAQTHIFKAAEEILTEVDQDTLKNIFNVADNSYISFRPRSSGAVDRELAVVQKSDLDMLTKGSLSDCGFCLLEGDGIRKCRKRKALLRCGIEGNGEEGGCEFSRI